MKRLYYATFENNFDEIVKSIIKKQDKNSLIKKLYSDSVLFFADEHFSFENSCFKAGFLVIDNIVKEGIGSLNVEMKHLLEKKNLKISFPREVSNFKLTFLKENDKVLIDANLKNAVEVLLKKVTKKSISYLSNQAELVFLSKSDGLALFMKRLTFSGQWKKIENRYDISPDVAYMVNYLSEPSAGEVVLNPFADTFMLSYVRSFAFKKANVISANEDKLVAEELKKNAKLLKDKSYSVLNYNFLSDSFPIKFIDKVICNLTWIVYSKNVSANEFYSDFFEKLYKLNVKVVVLIISKSHDINRFINNKFEIDRQVVASKYNVYKLRLIKKATN